MIICLKGVSEEGFWLNCNFKIIKASIKFITKVYTQKAICIAYFTRFPNQIILNNKHSKHSGTWAREALCLADSIIIGYDKYNSINSINRSIINNVAKFENYAKSNLPSRWNWLDFNSTIKAEMSTNSFACYNVTHVFAQFDITGLWITF